MEYPGAMLNHDPCLPSMGDPSVTLQISNPSLQASVPSERPSWIEDYPLDQPTFAEVFGVGQSP